MIPHRQQLCTKRSDFLRKNNSSFVTWEIFRRRTVLRPLNITILSSVTSHCITVVCNIYVSSLNLRSLYSLFFHFLYHDKLLKRLIEALIFSHSLVNSSNNMSLLDTTSSSILCSLISFPHDSIVLLNLLRSECKSSSLNISSSGR